MNQFNDLFEIVNCSYSMKQCSIENERKKKYIHDNWWTKKTLFFLERYKEKGVLQWVLHSNESS